MFQFISNLAVPDLVLLIHPAAFLRTYNIFTPVEVLRRISSHKIKIRLITRGGNFMLR